MVKHLDGLEDERGCGYREVGKQYLVGSGVSTACHRLPLKIPDECPCCSFKIKFHRGIQKINPYKLFGDCSSGDECPCIMTGYCPVCNPPTKAYLMWVGNKFYPKTNDFVMEADTMGVSKKIAKVPNDMVIGRDFVFLAHKKGAWETREKEGTLTGYEEVQVPGIFYVFVPSRVEMLVKDNEATEDRIKELEDQGITPVVVPDNYDEMVQNAKSKKKGKRKKRSDKVLLDEW